MRPSDLLPTLELRADDPGKERRASGEAFAATIAPPAPASGTVMPADEPPPVEALLPIVSDTLYRADREVARGGMGRIVAAEDQRLGRRVALKELLEPAGEHLTRFQREALITARLQHPGIVPVYEAGRWPTGEPFFAMKLVAGRPLDRVIAEARKLDQRLALLPRIAAAADAIAYAHSQRVVHRDLKPANVLIGDFGETVVIDWGLAKDLDTPNDVRPQPPRRPTLVPMPADGPHTLPERPSAKQRRSRPDKSGTAASTLTIAGAVMGTPAYMAPEQARGESVDERADVFALGAMLYHVLAGVPPYDARTATDVIAAAARGKVVPLDERERRAPQDLVAIVERAMAQAPEDRYPHAGELADELRRFMTGKLVSAHRYTALQRTSRFVKRHRAAVAVAAIAVVALVAGGALAVRRIVHERDNADRARTLAEIRQAAAERLIDQVLGDMTHRLSTIGRLDLMANLGGEIRDYYATLAKIPGGMLVEDLDRMAIAAELVGRAERDSAQADRALATWTDARARLAEVVGDDRSVATRFKRAMMARLDFQIGTIHQQRGAKTPAIAAYAQAKAEYAALLAEAPGDRNVLLGAAENADRIGDLLRNDGKLDAAFTEYDRARSARQRAASQTTSKPSEEAIGLSTSHLKIGTILQARGESAAALAEYRAGLRLRETALEGQPDNVQFQEKLIEMQDHVAELQRMIGDLASAADAYLQAVPHMDALVRRDPRNTQWKRQRGNLLADLGFTLLDRGDFDVGLGHLDRAIDELRELAARDPKNTTSAMDLAQAYTRAGDGHVYRGALDDGIAHYRRALALREKLAEREPTHVPYPRSVAWAHAKLANAFAYKRELDEAIAAHERALAIRARLAAAAPAQVGFKNELASSEIALGRLLVARDPARAAELIAAGLGRARALVATDAITNEWKRTAVQGLLAQAEVARAPAARRAALDEALAMSEAAAARAPQNVHWAGFVAEAQLALADHAAATGDGAAAAAARTAVRDRLEPLARAGRLPWPRKPLLERVRR